MNVTPKSEWKTNLNRAAQTSEKPSCFHLAVHEKQVDMIKEFVKICKNEKDEKTGESILDINCKDGKNRNPMRLAIDGAFYFGIKALFDENSDNAAYISEMIAICCRSEEEFSQENPKECKNYKFFQKLLQQPGIIGDSMFPAVLNRVKSICVYCLLNNVRFFIFVFWFLFFFMYVL